MTRPLHSLAGVSVAACLLLAAVCALNCLPVRAPAPQAQAEHGACSMPAAPQAPAPHDCDHHEAVAAAPLTVAPLRVNALADASTLPPADWPPAAAAQTQPLNLGAPAIRVLPFDALLTLRI